MSGSVHLLLEEQCGTTETVFSDPSLPPPLPLTPALARRISLLSSQLSMWPRWLQITRQRAEFSSTSSSALSSAMLTLTTAGGPGFRVADNGRGEGSHNQSICNPNKEDDPVGGTSGLGAGNRSRQIKLSLKFVMKKSTEQKVKFLMSCQPQFRLTLLK